MAQGSEELITVETVAIGLTKPTLKFGLPIAAAFGIVAISAEGILLGALFFKNPLFGLVGAPLYGLARSAVRHDEHFMDTMASAARTKWFNPARKSWQAVTASPLRFRRGR